MIENSAYFKAVEDSLIRFGSVRIRVKGTSMQPLLRDNIDEVTLTPCSSKDLKRLDIALFRYHEGYILHRLIGREGESLVFQGDNSIHAKECCRESDVIAKVTDIHRSYPLPLRLIYSSPRATRLLSLLRRAMRLILSKIRRMLPFG